MKTSIGKMTFAIVLALIGFIAVGPALAEQLVIKGSTTVLPAAQKIAEAYMQDRNISVSLSGGGSGNGLKAIIDGTTDIANASRFIKDKEIQMACDKGVYPVPFRIAMDCIVPVIHPSNPVTDLSLNQLEAIYTGKITNWKEVGGKDEKIVVVSRDSSSGTFEVWGEIVLEGGRVMPAALTVASNGAAVQTVANTAGAIGYIGLAYVNDSLKQVKVNGVLGNEATTMSGQYAVSRPLFMFTNGWPQGTVLDFINYVFSPKGQRLIQEVGSVPVFMP
jgi:phosphate transport system substrate-binding protein